MDKTTTPAASALGITPGEGSFVADSAMIGRYSIWADSTVTAVTSVRNDIPEEQARANAALYADAHNTANACGLKPSELLEKLREATRLLQWVREYGEEQKGAGMGFPDFLLSRIGPFLESLPKP